MYIGIYMKLSVCCSYTEYRACVLIAITWVYKCFVAQYLLQFALSMNMTSDDILGFLYVLKSAKTLEACKSLEF